MNFLDKMCNSMIDGVGRRRFKTTLNKILCSKLLYRFLSNVCAIAAMAVFEFLLIIIIMTMFMALSSWQSHCESSLGSFDECRTAPSGRRPKTKPDDLGCEFSCTGCQKLHPPSPFIITQPESWYSFYRPTEGRRLSRPSWLVTYRDGIPVHRRSPIRILTGSDVAHVWEQDMVRSSDEFDNGYIPMHCGARVVI